MPERPNPEAIRLHIAVAEAVQSGNGEGAEELMRSIIAESVAALDTVYEGVGHDSGR